MTPKQARDIMCGWERSGKELTPGQKRAGLLYDLHEEVDHWWREYERGTSDPYWEDGFNLNLTRIHIIRAVNALKELGEDYSGEIPRKVPDGLMIQNGEHFKARYDDFKNRRHVVVAGDQETLF